MYVLIKVGGNLGALNTVLLVLLTALIGVALLRIQGFRTLMNAKNKLGMAQLPAEEIITGIFLAIGGALLLTPGFITDIFGFLCLIPSTRRIFLKLFFGHLQKLLSAKLLVKVIFFQYLTMNFYNQDNIYFLDNVEPHKALLLYNLV